LEKVLDAEADNMKTLQMFAMVQVTPGLDRLMGTLLRDVGSHHTLVVGRGIRNNGPWSAAALGRGGEDDDEEQSESLDGERTDNSLWKLLQSDFHMFRRTLALYADMLEPTCDGWEVWLSCS